MDESQSVNMNMSLSSGMSSVFRSLTTERFAVGQEPFYAARSYGNILKAPTDIVGGELTHQSETFTDHLCIFRGNCWTVYTDFYNPGHSLTIEVFAEDHRTPGYLLDTIEESLEEYEPPRDTAVDMGFWCSTRNGPSRVYRKVDVPVWDEVRHNYSKATSDAMRDLMKVEPPHSADGGKLVLLHGPPGTGKTSAIRTIAREWKEWCQVEAVTDPEKLFGDAEYLNSLMLQESHSDTWRLIVLEDCDELLRGEAKAHTGQALSRLLNVSDGLIGQGQKLMIVLTTNERLSKLHPAVTRPGRCLAEIEVGSLSAEESSEWLGEEATKPMTLAELYARKNGTETNRALQEPDKSGTGQYL